MEEFGKMYNFEFIEAVFNKYSIAYLTENTLASITKTNLLIMFIKIIADYSGNCKKHIKAFPRTIQGFLTLSMRHLYKYPIRTFYS
jgi:hypothetical protein